MFTIIGGDNKPYGPSSVEEVREWLAQGRCDARTLARKDEGEWRPLANFQEFADLIHTPGALPSLPPTQPPSPDEIIARDFELDIIDCLKRGWALMQQNFWPLVGITFLVIAATAIINQIISLCSGSAVQDMFTTRVVTVAGVGIFFLTSLFSTIIQAVFLGGLYRYYLKLIRGEETTVGDAFSGFNLALGRLALTGLLMGLVTFFPPALYFFIWAKQGWTASGSTVAGALLCCLPAMYLTTGWFFSMALVIDRGLGSWSAMSLSLRVVNKHWFVVFALILFVGIVGTCGVCACGVGIFVTMPVSYLMLMYAYEDIFSRRAR